MQIDASAKMKTSSVTDVIIMAVILSENRWGTMVDVGGVCGGCVDNGFVEIGGSLVEIG